MKDRYNRTIDYMRISITDRCNYHCVYCNPDKFKFIYSTLYKPCIFKAYRLLNVQTLCIFPCFCPYEPKQGKFFILRRLPYPAVLRKYASLPL